MKSEDVHYRTQIVESLTEIDAEEWQTLLDQQDHPNPFLSYAFLAALENNGCVGGKTGWHSRYFCLKHDGKLEGVIPFYEKHHSYGEYVFDWAWANAYHQHGLEYYPKLLAATPFTPVTGNRLLASSAQARLALLKGLQQLRELELYSSTHLLFATEEETKTLETAGFLVRQNVQFHWKNQDYRHFDDFLANLSAKKSKNIRAERRKVREAGVHFKRKVGAEITAEDWRFFTQCYDNTYHQHHSTPYLNLGFFQEIGATMHDQVMLICAYRNDTVIAAALFLFNQERLYGRYWGCTEYIPCLHFETAYYQALEFCIERGILWFEGGAQGEHKMARGFMPHTMYSAHYLREPAFYDAVANFLKHEKNGVSEYIDELHEHTPFRESQDSQHS